MKHRILIPALCVVLSACGKESSPAAKDPAKPVSATSDPAPAPKEAPDATPAFDPEKTGTVTGTVKLDGKIPPVRYIRMGADPKCAAMHASRVKSDQFVVDGNRNVKWAFVRVKSGLPKMNFPAPKAPVVLNQKGCMYEPHLFGVMLGQEILIRNSDGTLHNIHALPYGNREFNFAQQPGQENTKAFTTEEVPIRIKCDIHPWMLTWGMAMTHPFFSVTDAAGKFEIKGLPAGKYTLEVWHEKCAPVTAQVEVKANATATVDLQVKER